MAMQRCKECGNPVSSKAPTCPSCGAPVKKAPKRAGCLSTAILLIVFFAVLSAYLGNLDSSRTDAPALPKTAEQLKQEKLGRQFSSWNGAHIELQFWIKENLKDPGSYEHIETKFIHHKTRDPEQVQVFTKFRSKNSFGGYAIETATGTFDLEGNALTRPQFINQ